MKKTDKISSLYREGLEDYPVSPSPTVWQKLSRELWWKDFLHFRPFQMNVYYLTGLLGISASLIYFSTRPEAFPEQAKQTTNLRAIKAPTEQIGDLPDTPGVLKKATKTQPEKKIKPADKDNKPTTPKQTEEKTEAPVPSLKEPIGRQEKSKLQLTSDPDSIADSTPNAFFTASAREGCPPLQVKFRSLANKEYEYYWSFGDGGTSKEENPEYIFDVPGQYIINLIVRDQKNLSEFFTDTILVFETPRALFEMEKPAGYSRDHAFYFYNFSRGAENFKWDFGDGTFSEEKEPVKIYKKEGKYNIQLVATNTLGCSDTAFLLNALQRPEPQIVIPTSFSPNPYGPVGGYYSDRESNNEVFRPYISEDPVDYNLKIFNRQGNMIFESNDYRMGWDGYYHKALQPPGVYVWKLRMRFEDGKVVVRMGDVTLLRE